jgi:hypothetical protein
MDMAVIELADRIRSRIGDRPGVVEKKMFGAMAFMVHGNMLVAAMKGGNLLVRTGKEAYEAALARPGAGPMVMGDRTMSGFVEVSGDSIEDDDALDDWVALAQAFVSTLPSK